SRSAPRPGRCVTVASPHRCPPVRHAVTILLPEVPMTTRPWFRKLFARPATRPAREAARMARPRVESLEGRSVPSASPIYVDASIAAHSTSAVRDGSSWANAFDNLQDALDKAAATPGDDQIWIAEGTYTPSKVYAPLDANDLPVPGGAAGQN